MIIIFNHKKYKNPDFVWILFLLIFAILFGLCISPARAAEEKSLYVSTIAGSDLKGTQDATGSAAFFNNPLGVAVDFNGNIYIADTWNHKIRKIQSSGEVSTLAGSGIAGGSDGKGTLATFHAPTGIAVDTAGNVYVVDCLNNKIRKITPDGIVSTLAGSGVADDIDGIGKNASFNRPFGIALAVNGDIYVTDSGNHKIRKITPAGLVTSYPVNIRRDIFYYSDFDVIRGITVDKDGNLYISKTSIHYSLLADPASLGAGYIYDSTNINKSKYYKNAITKITPNGRMSELAYSQRVENIHASNWYSDRYVETNSPGVSPAMPLNLPIYGLIADGDGNIYATDTFNRMIRKIKPNGDVSIFAGTVGLSPNKDGTVNVATFESPTGISIDGGGNIYTTDGHRVRKIYHANIVSTAAGSGKQGWIDDIAPLSSFKSPEGIAIDFNDNTYVADTFNNKIRKISRGGLVSTFAGSGAEGSIDGPGSLASFYNPQGVAVDISGNVYVADSGNGTIRKIDRAGVVSTMFDRATSAKAKFRSPSGVAVDLNGNVYVADFSKIYKISVTGTVTELAGSRSTGYADGAGAAALFDRPFSLAVDSAGNVYVADTINNRIRKITPSGRVSTLAGTGDAGFLDGISTMAQFNKPHGIAVDAIGNVYVADYWNNKIRKISSTGWVSSLAGSGILGDLDGIDKIATFSNPVGIAVDAKGGIHVGDFRSRKIRKISLLKP